MLRLSNKKNDKKLRNNKKQKNDVLPESEYLNSVILDYLFSIN